MGKAASKIRWVHIDISDDDLTEVWVMIDALGDCPIGVQGCHHKTLPAHTSLDEVMMGIDASAMLWPLEEPPFEYR